MYLPFPKFIGQVDAYGSLSFLLKSIFCSIKFFHSDPKPPIFMYIPVIVLNDPKTIVSIMINIDNLLINDPRPFAVTLKHTHIQVRRY